MLEIGLSENGVNRYWSVFSFYSEDTTEGKGLWYVRYNCQKSARFVSLATQDTYQYQQLLQQ